MIEGGVRESRRSSEEASKHHYSWVCTRICGTEKWWVSENWGGDFKHTLLGIKGSWKRKINKGLSTFGDRELRTEFWLVITATLGTECRGRIWGWNMRLRIEDCRFWIGSVAARREEGWRFALELGECRLGVMQRVEARVVSTTLARRGRALFEGQCEGCKVSCEPPKLDGLTGWRAVWQTLPRRE